MNTNKLKIFGVSLFMSTPLFLKLLVSPKIRVMARMRDICISICPTPHPTTSEIPIQTFPPKRNRSKILKTTDSQNRVLIHWLQHLVLPHTHYYLNPRKNLTNPGYFIEQENDH